MTFFTKLKKLRKNNKGASFFIVIVAMLFLTVLSTAIVYSSFTAYNVKTTSKRANTAFYTVDNAMEEIKTGFQNVVSKCAKDGYEKALLVFNDPSSDITQIFADTYRNSFYNYQYESAKNLFVLESSGIVSGKATGKIKKEGILSFVDDALKSKVTIMNDSDPSFELVQNSEGLIDVTIKGLKVEFTDQGYTSHVSTDIKLMMPQVVIYGDNSANPLERFVMIADKGIDTAANARDKSNALVIDGDAFFGDINVSQNKSLVFKDGSKIYVGAVKRDDFTTEGKITVSDTAKLYTGNGTEIWAKDIEVKEKGRFIGTDEETCKTYTGKDEADLSGVRTDVQKTALNNVVSGKRNTFYIADDLSLSEEGQALITGTYYGFGNSTKPLGRELDDFSEYSSAIIFPQKTTKGTDGRAILDLNGCRQLSLSGTAYVVGDELVGEGLSMGSSIASTKEQLIYLAPANFFEKGSNPMLLTAGSRDELNTKITELENRIIDNNYLSTRPLFKVNGQDRYASSYNLNNAGNLSFFVKNLNPPSNNYAVYCFFKFDNRTDANNYFKEYLSSNLGQDITKYLNDYAEIRYNSANIFALDGTEFIPNESGSIASVGGKGPVDSSFLDSYMKISQTMMPTVSQDNMSPFYYNIDVEKLREFINNGDLDYLKSFTGYTDIEITDGGPGDTYRLVTVKKTDPKLAGVDTAGVEFIISSADLYVNDKSEVFRTTNDVQVDTATDHNTCTKADDTLQLVICDGDVVLNGGNGGIMIMCSGAIYPGAAHTTLGGGNTGTSDNQKPSTILKNSGFYRNSVPTGDDDWNIDQQVIFENWKKNEG